MYFGSIQRCKNQYFTPGSGWVVLTAFTKGINEYYEIFITLYRVCNTNYVAHRKGLSWKPEILLQKKILKLIIY